MALLRGRQPPRLPTVAASVEASIRADPQWREGMACRFSGPGHPEDTVGDHVEEVLGNVEREPAALQPALRVIGLVHDAFKHEVRWWWPGRTDHAAIAARFARRHTDDAAVLKVVRRHDDAYRAWRLGARTGQWWLARARARALIRDLGDDLGLYLAFYRCDNATGDKSAEPREWFLGVAETTRAGRTLRRS